MLSVTTRTSSKSDAAVVHELFTSQGRLRDAWLGTPRTLRYLDYRMDPRPGQAVDPEHLGVALWEPSGSHRRPGRTTTELTLTAPRAVSERWQLAAAGGHTRTRIEDALMRAANVGLETCTLRAGVVRRARAGHEQPRGLAAAAVLRLAGRGDGSGAQDLRVHVVIAGVERVDGLVVGPDPRAIERALATADEAALGVLEAELAGAEQSAGAGTDASPQLAGPTVGQDALPFETAGDREREIADAAPAIPQPAPDAQRNEPEAEQTRRATAESAPAPSRSALDAYRPILGEERAHAIGRAADAHRESALAADSGDLRRELRALGNPLELVGRAGARATLTNERDLAVARDRVASTMANRHIGDDAREQCLREDRGQLARAEGRERHLRDSGRHLDHWMRAKADHAARWVAVADVLAGRREQALAVAAEQAIATPPEEIVTRLGPAPRDPHERRAWEQLVAKLTRSQRELELRELDGAPARRLSASEDRELEQEVSALRRARGMDMPTSEPSGPDAAVVAGIEM